MQGKSNYLAFNSAEGKMEASVFVPAHFVYNFTDVKVGAVSYRYRSRFSRTSKENVDNGRTESREAGPIVQEGMANHPASNDEHIILQQLLGHWGDEVIRLALKYSDGGHAACSSDGIQVKDTPLSFRDCVFSGLWWAHAHTGVVRILPKFIWSPLISLEIIVEMMWRSTPLPVATSPVK